MVRSPLSLIPLPTKGWAAGKAELLRRSLAQFESASLEPTRFAGHATELARDAASDGATLIACGGDGTLNEVVNAVAGQPVNIGILPIGSANDVLKMFEPSKQGIEERIRSLAGASSRRVDFGRMEFGDGSQRLFVNSIGIGFTGRIAKCGQIRPLAARRAIVRLGAGERAVGLSPRNNA